MNEYQQHPLSAALPGNEACNAGNPKNIASRSGEHTRISQSGFQCTYVPQLGALIRGGGSVHLKLRGEA